MKLLRILTIVFCFLFAKGFANCGSPCGAVNPCCFAQDCCFEFGGEWLYMRPSTDQPYYALNGGADGATFPFGDRFPNDQSWHSGYRLEAIYYFPNKLDHVRARWTQFPSFSESDSRDTARLFPILNDPFLIPDGVTHADIRDKFNFYYLEILVGRRIYCLCPLTISVEAGVQFARIDFNEQANYLNPSDDLLTVRAQSRFKGVGPEFAVDFSYGILSCLSFDGRAVAALLVNERKSHFTQVFIDTLVTNSENRRYWYGTPAFDFRLGLNYHRPFSFCWCNRFNVSVEVGYEVIHFVKATDRIYFMGSSNLGSSETQHMDFTMHGPYVHAGICF